jgi:hypothetical protein
MSPNQHRFDPTAPACAPFRAEIEALLFEAPLASRGEAPASTRPALEPSGALARHLGECPACAELLALHAELIAWEDAQPAPTELEEARIRRRVLAELERENTASPRARADSAAPASQRLALAAALLLALALAFVGGRLSSPGPDRDLPATGGPGVAGLETEPDFAGSLLQPVAASLRAAGPAADLDGAPYSFDDVQLRELGDGRIRLSFDYTVHLELERPRSDPLVTEVLIHAMLDGGSLGTQLRAIEVAEQPALPPRLRAALLRTMLSDESAPARQAALERLLPDAHLPEVESALLEVLEHEPGVHMRLLAIDALAARGVPTRRLEQALALGPAEPGRALQLRVGSHARDL